MTLEDMTTLVIPVFTVGWLRRTRTPILNIDPETGERRLLCPECEKGEIRRSKARNFLERVRRDYSRLRVFRCERCGWRGWLEVIDPGHNGDLGDHAVDLTELDDADFQTPIQSSNSRKKRHRSKRKAARRP